MVTGMGVKVRILLSLYQMLNGIASRASRMVEGMGVKVRILLSLYQMLNGVGIVFDIPYPKAYLQATPPSTLASLLLAPRATHPCAHPCPCPHTRTQAIALSSHPPIPSPAQVLRALSSVLELNLPKAMPLSCAVPAASGFLVSLVFRTAVPLVIIVALALAANLIRRRAPDHPAVMLCSTSWFFVLFLVYPGCSSAVFSAFICDPLEDGTPMLRVDYSVVCWEGDHLAIAGYALLMGVIYPLGTPCLYAAMLYANRATLEAIRAAELSAGAKQVQATYRRAAGSTSSPASVLTEAAAARAAEARASRRELPPVLQKLTAGYEMRCYWFELFECLRKILLVGLPVLLPAGSSAQLMFGLLVCFISMAVYSTYAPYVRDGDDRLAKICQLSLFFSLASSIALKMEPDSSSGPLAGLLVVMLALPPALAFAFESDLDFERGLHLAALRPLVRRLLEATCGACAESLFKTAEAPAQPAALPGPQPVRL